MRQNLEITESILNDLSRNSGLMAEVEVIQRESRDFTVEEIGDNLEYMKDESLINFTDGPNRVVLITNRGRKYVKIIQDKVLWRAVKENIEENGEFLPGNVLHGLESRMIPIEYMSIGAKDV